MKYKLECIKCKKSYDTDDPDPYYCETCNTAKQKIADEVDKKFANRPKKKVMSSMERYDSVSDGRGFVRAQDLL